MDEFGCALTETALVTVSEQVPADCHGRTDTLFGSLLVQLEATLDPIILISIAGSRFKQHQHLQPTLFGLTAP